MKILKLVLFIGFLGASFFANALTYDDISKQVNKDAVKQALAQMEASGKFTPEQIAQARKELDSMSDDQYKRLIKKGVKTAQDPEFKQKVKESLGQ